MFTFLEVKLFGLFHDFAGFPEELALLIEWLIL